MGTLKKESNSKEFAGKKEIHTSSSVLLKEHLLVSAPVLPLFNGIVKMIEKAREGNRDAANK